MQWEELHRPSAGPDPVHEKSHSARSVYNLAIMGSDTQHTRQFPFGINSLVPPSTDPQFIMPRMDEVVTIQRMLTDAQTSAVMLIGSPGAGKSILATLLYQRYLLAQQSGLPTPRYLLWLEVGTYTTLPDMIAAILNGIQFNEPGLFLSKPEQQIATLLRALRRSREPALVVLDQFESLLHPEMQLGVAGRGSLSLFLEMLQNDLGQSRIVLTSYNSPYPDEMEESRVRSYLVSRLSIPEGQALLQRYNVQGTPEERSLLWQRCAGHVFALTLFNAITKLSGISLNYLLNAPELQPLWTGEVTFHFIATVYHYLNPVQYVLMRALSLFIEPVPLRGVIMAVTGSGTSNADSSSTFERELNGLVVLGLVQQMVNVAGKVCFILHPLLRQYITEHYLEGYERHRTEGVLALGVNMPQLTDLHSMEAYQGALAAGHVQVAAYYQLMTLENCPPSEQRRGLQDIEPIITAIRHLCLGGRSQRACDLLFAEGLHESMVQWGAWNALIGLYIALLPPFGSLAKRDEGLVCGHIGMLYGRMGEYQQSQSYFERALHIQREVEDRNGEAMTLVNHGELLRTLGERSLARANFERALTLNKERRDPYLKGILLHNLGLLYQEEKDYQQALNYYREALRLKQDPQSRGMILTSVGMLLYEQGNMRESLAVLLGALRLRQTVQDPSVVMLESFMGALEHKMGSEMYHQLCQSALGIQQQLISRLM